MKNLKKLLLTGIVGMITSTSFGQLTLSGELRPRAEYRNGYKTTIDSSQTNGFFVDQRTRIKLDYKHEDYQFFVSVQDIRTWGSTAQLNSTDGFLSVHQAWAKAKLNETWGLKVGRQEIVYDDHRIFGSVGWAQQARSHDAAIFQYKSGDAKFDFGLAFNQASPTSIGTDYLGPTVQYRDMYFGRYNNKFGKTVNLSLLALMTGRQFDHTVGPDTYKSMNYMATIGTHTKFDFGKFKLNFNGYMQTGSDISDFTTIHPTDPMLNSTTATKISSYLIGIDASYKLTDEFSVGFGYETQSGNNPSDTTDDYGATTRAFNPIFGTNHKFNGFMDYFYVGSGHGNVGLQDAYLKLKYKKGTWTYGLDVHMFMTGFGAEVLDNDTYVSESIIQASATLDPFDYKYTSSLGTEIDLSIGTKLNKSVSLKAGYSMMLASDLMYNLKGDARYNIDGVSGAMNEIDVPMNNWGYVMLIFKPTFIK